MDFNILKVKSFNILIYTLMGLQLAILISVATILISAVSDLELSTTISTVVMFLLGMPMLLLLYQSSTDRIQKTILLGLTANAAILSASGIIWYIMADALNAARLVQIAKALMVIGYAPLIYSLYYVLQTEHKKMSNNAKIFILFINVSCSLMVLFYAAAHLAMGNSFDVAVYTLSVLSDIAILAMASMLITIYTRTRLRYLLAIVFGITLLSFIGDSLNLLIALRVDAYGLTAFAQYFYDAMLLFLVASLLIYSFFKEMSATTVEEVDKKLHDTRHIMDDLIMQSPDATCVYSVDGDPIMANDPFLRMFGVQRECLFKSFNLFRHAEGLDCGFKIHADKLAAGRTILMDKVKLAIHGDKSLYISLKIFPTYSSDGAISGYISICEDITERARAEEELIQAKMQAELYIDLMGHDINNMNQIGMGYLEMAMDTMALNDHDRLLIAKPLEVMNNSSRLIDNVRKLQKAKAGDLCLKPIDLGAVLMEVIHEYSAVPGRDVAVRYEVKENCFVLANELLKDVFINLTNNAVKHSKGPLLIRIKQEPFDRDGKKSYRVSIEDNGPGIADDLKPIIFDRIYRSKTRSGGNGLGLYLVKTLVDDFSGTITVEDRIAGDRSQGSRFVVTLPAV